MKYYGMVVLVAIAVSTAGCDRQIQPRPEVNWPAPAMTIFEEPVTVEFEPDASPDESSNELQQIAPVKSATPANINPPPAPLRPRQLQTPMPCSDDYIGGAVCSGGCVGTCSAVLHFEEHDPTSETVDDTTLGESVDGKTCIMEVILNEDFTIRGARMLDGRIFTYDPTRNRLLEQAATQTETMADKPWYAVSRAELERDVFPVIAIGMGILFLVLLARFIVRHRRDNHQWPWGYQDRPINRDRISDHTPPSHNHRGGLTEQEFRALSRAEQIRLERAMVDIEIESARGAAQFAHQRRRNTLDLELVRFREQRKLIEASVQAEIEQINAASEAMVARFSALRAGYEADEEETTGVYFDVEGAFEEHGATEPDNMDDDPDGLDNSQIRRGEDDDFDPDGNV